MATNTKKDAQETYDPETDTMYVSFGGGEPSFSEEIDDILVIERGVFSGLPTGFRIIDFKKHKVKSVAVRLRRKLEDAVRREEKEVRENVKARTQLLQRGIASALHSA